MSVEFIFRDSRVGGKRYIQIWGKDVSVTPAKYRYMGTIGHAGIAYKLLVKVRELEELTKDLSDKFTKVSKENIQLLTKLGER